MGLKDRIEDEMIVESEDVLEAEFDRAQNIVRILGDGSVQLREAVRDIPPKEKILAHLIGNLYAYKAEKIEEKGVKYQYFYERIPLDDSTIRNYMGDLQDNNLVQKEEETSKWNIVSESLSRAIDRIESESDE